MDKQLVLAAAGSGKTSHIVKSLSENERNLIVTYTKTNLRNIRLSLIRRFGYIPEGTKVISYFTFVHSFCYKPFLAYRLKTKGLNYKINSNRFAKGKQRYIDKYGRIYSNRIAKLIELEGAVKDVQNRLEKYYDVFFIDEVQDIAGHDFNLIMQILGSRVKMLFVGDFFQHTFDTSRDGIVNKTLHDDYENYIKLFKTKGLEINNTALIKSYRCSDTICNFIMEKLNINIESHRACETNIEMLDTKENILNVFDNNEIVKLFYQNRKNYKCNAMNWGESKGDDSCHDVCVVLNKKSYDMFCKDKLFELPPSTKNKLYVALTRARNNIYLINQADLDRYLKER